MEETAAGARVSMTGLLEAGGDEVPALPMALKTFYVPEGFEVASVRATPGEEIRVGERIRLAKREALLEPTQAEVRRGFPKAALDESSDRHPARGAVVLGGGNFAGHRIDSVALFPVRWEASGDLVFTKSFDLELELRPARSAGDLVRQRSSTNADRAFHEALSAIVANPQDLPFAPSETWAPEEGGFSPRDLPSVEGSTVDMVIITPAALSTGFQTLADWKTKKGVTTVIRTVEWINTNYPAGHDVSERIRLFLQDAYSKWGTFLALLGGDFDEVTPRLAYNRFWPPQSFTLIPTDQYFACLDGDWNGDGDDKIGEGVTLDEAGDGADLYPDLFVGRAPVADLTEVATFVAKSLLYDKSPPAGYVEDHCILAEVLFPDDWEFGVDPPESIQLDGKTLTETMDLIVDSTWTRTKLYQSDGNESRALALAELSAGHHMLSIMNHGDAFKFSVGNGTNPLIYVSDTDTLTNGDRLHVMVATACNPNQFDLESCGESMLNNPNGGAIVSIGPTRVDFPNSATSYHEEMLRILFRNCVTRFGAMTQVNRVAFVANSQTDQTPDRWTMLTKNLLGDPELHFWTKEPQQLLVSHPGSVQLGTGSVLVTVTDQSFTPVADAIVCVSDGNGTYSRAKTDASGQATVPLSSTDTGTVDVVVTAKNFFPKETTFDITPTGSANLAVTGHVLDDDSSGSSSGNGDGRLDAGESVELDVTALNSGGSTANLAQLNASIESGTSATFDLLINGVRTATSVFVGPDRINPGSVPFTLDFANPSIDYTGTPSISYGPDPTDGDTGIFLWQDRMGWHLWWSDGADSLNVTGTVTTDGRVRDTALLELEDGDTATISVAGDTLTIDGTTHKTDLFDQLDFSMSDDTMVSITTGTDLFGTINPSASASATVVFDVSNSARSEQIAYIDLQLTSTSGGPWSAEIPIVLAAPSLEAIVFEVDDSAGDNDGVIEVGESVTLTPTVLNRGTGGATTVIGTASAASGITFTDALDVYGDIAPLGQSSGTNGFQFTVNDGSGTSIDLTLTDSVGRIWMKNLDFVAPPAPDSLDFRSTSTEITLFWAPPADTTLAGYNVYRSLTPGTGYAKQNFELLRAGSRYVDEGHTVGDQFYYRVTAVDSSGNESAVSDSLQAWTTLAQIPGFPQYAGNNVIGSLGITNADALDNQEIYGGSKDFNFYAWDFDGDVRAGFPIETEAEVWGTPLLVDIDRDGDEEIFFGANDSRMRIVHHDGSPVYGGDEVFLDLAGGGELMRSAVSAADVDFDAQLEFFFGTDKGHVYAYNHDGTGLIDPSGIFYSVTPTNATSKIWGSVAIADLEGDGVRELVFTSWNDSLYAVTPDGNLKPGFPRGASGGLNFDDYRTGPVVGDIDNDGTMEILAGNTNGTLYVYNHDGSGYLNPDGTFVALGAGADDGIRCIPALGNLDADPQLEIVIGHVGTTDLYVFNHDGTGFLDPDPTVPYVDFNEAVGLGISASPLIVDVDGDGDFEILIGHRNGDFYGYHAEDASRVVGLPIPTDDAIFSTAAAADIDFDGDVDVAFASFDGTVNVIDFSGASTPAAYEWPTYAGNNWRSSVYGELGPWQTSVDPTLPGALSFALMQNAPNPFAAGGTTIQYVLPRDAQIALRVYNVSGRLVRTLIEGPAQAGPGRATWDGRDEHGQSVSSGVYFYRLENGEESLTRKSLILR